MTFNEFIKVYNSYTLLEREFYKEDNGNIDYTFINFHALVTNIIQDSPIQNYRKVMCSPSLLTDTKESRPILK